VVATAAQLGKRETDVKSLDDNMTLSHMSIRHELVISDD